MKACAVFSKFTALGAVDQWDHDCRYVLPVVKLSQPDIDCVMPAKLRCDAHINAGHELQSVDQRAGLADRA